MMDGLRQATAAEPGPVPRSTPPGTQEQPTDEREGIVDTARHLFGEGNGAVRSTLATLQSLKTLAVAELGLATAAVGRAALMAVGAALAALIGIFYVFATLSAFLVSLGLGWAAALGISTVLLLLIAGVLAWRAMALLKMTRFEGTRRQLARIREGTP